MTTANLPQRALWLAYLTVGYNVLEAAASLIAGTLAGSIALVGFGLDSLVESLSGLVIIWRFTRVADLPPEREAHVEQRAARLIGITFFVLGAYVLYESAGKLYFQEPPSPTLLGLIIAGVSVVIMPALFLYKYRTGKALGSVSVVADSKQTLACAFLSLALLIGLGLNYWFGLWQADPAMGLVVAGYLFREGYETLKAGKPCSCCGPCG